MIRSSLAAGTPSIPSDLNSGLRSITNSRSGSDSVIVNGPVPGGGCCVAFRNGVSAGTGAANGSASR